MGAADLLFFDNKDLPTLLAFIVGDVATRCLIHSRNETHDALAAWTIPRFLTCWRILHGDNYDGSMLRSRAPSGGVDRVSEAGSIALRAPLKLLCGNSPRSKGTPGYLLWATAGLSSLHESLIRKEQIGAASNRYFDFRQFHAVIEKPPLK